MKITYSKIMNMVNTLNNKSTESDNKDHRRGTASLSASNRFSLLNSSVINLTSILSRKKSEREVGTLLLYVPCEKYWTNKVCTLPHSCIIGGTNR